MPKAKPRFVEPMKPRLVEKAPPGGDWLYELKFDGIRAIAVKIDNKEVKNYLYTAREAEALLKDPHHAAHRRLGDVELVGGGGEAALPASRLERA